MTYCAAGDVQAIVQGAAYSANTTPTLAQVNAWIDQITAEMDISLNDVGYVVPVVGAANSLLLLKTIATFGVAAFAVQDDDAAKGESRSIDYRGQFESMMNDIISGATKLYDAATTALVADFPYLQVRSGNLEPEADGSAKAPVMTRGQVF